MTTTMTSEMKRLAGECEAALSSSRDLDWRIAEALGEVPEHRIVQIGWDYVWYRQEGDTALWRAKDSEGRDMELWTPTPRTASLDAALTLVPEGYAVDLTIWPPNKSRARLMLCYEDGGRWLHRGSDPYFAVNAATPALALTAAALRARASLSLREGSDVRG